MPSAVSTIMQTGQVSIPKIIREILGVKPHDQVQFVSDGERVQILAVSENPLTLGTQEEFFERVRLAEAAYEAGEYAPAGEVSRQLREKHGL